MRINRILSAVMAIASAPLLHAGDCCPPGALPAPCCNESKTPNYGALYSSWPNICHPCPPTGWEGSLDVSFLYWQAQEDGLDFAVKNNPLFTPSPDLYADMNGRLIGLDFHWEPAFKINASLLFPNGWDFDARWTSFTSTSRHTTASASVVANTTSGLYPLWVLPQSYQANPSIFGRASASWNLHLNTLDLELGINPCLTPRLSLRLHGGLKGLSIFQKFHVSYSEGINVGGMQLLKSGAAIKNNCYALGPRIGFDSKWRLGKGWSIEGDLAGSFTLSSFTLKRDDFDNSIDQTGPTVFTQESSFRESLYVFRPNLEALLGLGWDLCYGCRGQYSLGFSAAYELQYYWEQNLMPQLVSNQIAFLDFSSRGDLHCHGLSATLRFGF